MGYVVRHFNAFKNLKIHLSNEALIANMCMGKKLNGGGGGATKTTLPSA